MRVEKISAVSNSATVIEAADGKLHPRVVCHSFAYEDLVKSGFAGEHTESNHRLM